MYLVVCCFPARRRPTVESGAKCMGAGVLSEPEVVFSLQVEELSVLFA